MKKLLTSFVIASSIFIISCDNSTKTTDSEKTESKTDKTDVNVTTTKENPNQVQIQAGKDSASLKIGTKDVQIDVRTNK